MVRMVTLANQGSGEITGRSMEMGSEGDTGQEDWSEVTCSEERPHQGSSSDDREERRNLTQGSGINKCQLLRGSGGWDLVHILAW